MSVKWNQSDIVCLQWACVIAQNTSHFWQWIIDQIFALLSVPYVVFAKI